MTADEETPRTVILIADDQPFPVVFEMMADTVILQPRESLRLVVRGPQSAALTIGHGANGVSVLRDDDLSVEVFGPTGEKMEIVGF
ncbi:MAG TPA: hypothetical protein VE441_10455 [Mycobacterium sp.]|nr:hypothetical protein [Mycobacterium sp.]